MDKQTQSDFEASAELKRRMTKLGIDGFSSMGNFSIKDHHAHLDEIEKIHDSRRVRSTPSSSGEVAH